MLRYGYTNIKSYCKRRISRGRDLLRWPRRGGPSPIAIFLRRICPSTIGPQPHITEMGKPHAEFEPIELKDYSGWYVLITLHHGAEHRISFFTTEADARTWIGENSAAWLTTYTDGNMSRALPAAPHSLLATPTAHHPS